MSGDCNAITIQEDIKFKLRSPRIGKLKCNQIYSAYNKTNLSSIPSKVEVVLIKDKTAYKTNPLLSQYSSSFCQSDLHKTASQTQQITRNNDTFMIKSPGGSSKGYGNGFVSNNTRFEQLNDYQEKYKPGPGEYYNERDFSNSHNRYRSLFVAKSSNPNIPKEILPGPGFYYPNTKYITMEDFQNSCIFRSRNQRFKEAKKEKLGPGVYKDHIDQRWNSDKPSPFFHINKTKEENKLEKYINVYKNQELHSPGPGHYEVKSSFPTITKSQSKPDINPFSLLFSSNGNQLIPDELKEFNKRLANEQKYLAYSLNNNEEDTIIKKPRWTKELISSPFISKAPRGILNNDKNKHHNPGPCYYNQSDGFKRFNIIKPKHYNPAKPNY